MVAGHGGSTGRSSCRCRCRCSPRPAIFSFLWTWNDFFGPLIYLNDIANYTVPLALRSFIDATGTSAWGQLFAMSVLAILPIFLVFLFFQRLIISGVALSGLKR